MRKTKLDNWICEVEALPELTREGLEALQLERLNRTLSRLRQRGGFYASYPEKLNSLAELETLPFTTPQMLADAPGKFLLTSQSQVDRVISGATSGTTGPAKRVFYTARDTEHTVGFFAAGISEMLCPGEKCFIAFPFSGHSGLGDLIGEAVKKIGGIPIQAGYGWTWDEARRMIRQEKPETYIGFPVPLLGMARILGEDFSIRKALVSGDACPVGVMEELEKLLGSKLYPHYGSRECGLGGGVTCPAFEGMHLRENHIYPEIIDENGRVLPEGEYGELVITTLGMEAMPLIRYRTGDYTRILPSCPCGGVTRRIGPVSRKEEPFSMEKLDSALFQLPELADYRAVYHGDLMIEARTLGAGLEEPIARLVSRIYPDVTVTVNTGPCHGSHRPLYPGKRYVIRSCWQSI